MLAGVKILLLLTLSIIFYQDFKERRVWAFLFLLFGLLGSYLFYRDSEWEFYKLSILINLGIIIIVLLMNYLFARFILKKRFLKEALGLGDVLFFLAFAISFPTVTFINFFVFSILFTFVFHIVLKNVSISWHKNPPLAGCMSLFLIAVYLTKWLGLYESIYVL
jgi:hypothetical protein